MFSDIYVDESSQTKCRYLVLGASIIPQIAVADATKTILGTMVPELPHGEMKWGKV
jgi:hypothetical protein